MNIYLDTEFTDLHPENSLISIALVDENEEFFYAELTDTYTLDECSEFVKENVLPLLRGGDYRMSFNECALKIGHWIEERNKHCIIASDAPGWDLPHLQNLLSPIWPKNLEKLVIPIHIPFHIKEDLVIEFDYDEHNALHDALLMKKAMEIKAKLKF